MEKEELENMGVTLNREFFLKMIKLANIFFKAPDF